MTQEEWDQKRDAIAREFPVGTRVETVPDCFGMEYDDGMAFRGNGEDAGMTPVRGVVVAHTASRVEFADERDGGVWTMQPASLRRIQ